MLGRHLGVAQAPWVTMSAVPENTSIQHGFPIHDRLRKLIRVYLDSLERVTIPCFSPYFPSAASREDDLGRLSLAHHHTAPYEQTFVVPGIMGRVRTRGDRTQM